MAGQLGNPLVSTCSLGPGGVGSVGLGIETIN